MTEYPRVAPKVSELHRNPHLWQVFHLRFDIPIDVLQRHQQLLASTGPHFASPRGITTRAICLMRRLDWGTSLYGRNHRGQGFFGVTNVQGANCGPGQGLIPVRVRPMLEYAADYGPRRPACHQCLERLWVRGQAGGQVVDLPCLPWLPPGIGSQHNRLEG